MEYLKFEEVLEAANKFLLDPENEEKLIVYNSIKEKLIIKKHLSLAQRENIILRSLIDIRSSDEEMNLGQISNAFEISLTFNALLSYTNIEPDFSPVYKNDIVYDILWESGLMEYILEFCEKDYDRVEKQFYQIISYQNLINLIENMDSLKLENIEELTNSFKNFSLKLDPAVVKNLAEIAKFNDPFVQNLKDEIVQSSYKGVMKSESYKS